MNRHERILAWVLRLSGIVMLTALGAVIMPYDWMNAIHRLLEMGDLPRAPIVDYLTRSASLLYAMHGALLLYLSLDLRNRLPVVRFLALAGIVFGLAMLGIDLAAGLPKPWTVAESPFIVLVSSLIFWLSKPL